ncbi:MAG: cytochrome c3 family protein, partial [Deltaproteobacteria bacterium]
MKLRSMCEWAKMPGVLFFYVYKLKDSLRLTAVNLYPLRLVPERVSFLFVLLALGLMLSGCVYQGIGVRKSCADCHAKELVKYSEGVLHKPVADKNCEACHAPHGLIGALKLKKHDGAALCYDCHAKDKKRFEKAHLHAPVKEGQCLRCHDPHSSYKTKGVPGLVRAAGNDLCFLCHAKEAFEAKSVHAAVKQGCNTCHDPHSSDVRFTLLTDGNALCAKCHDIGNAKGITAHSGYNVKGTRCLTCHAPHASSGDGKLRRA